MKVRNVRTVVTTAAALSVLAVALDGLLRGVHHPFGSVDLLWIGAIIAAALVLVALGIFLYADLFTQIDELTGTVEQLEAALQEALKELRSDILKAVEKAYDNGYAEGHFSSDKRGNGAKVTPLSPRKPS